MIAGQHTLMVVEYIRACVCDCTESAQQLLGAPVGRNDVVGGKPQKAS